MKRRVLAAFVLFPFLVQGCTLVPVATSSMIERKMEKISLGQNKNQVTGILGSPQYLIEILHESNKFEILGYELGHYWYNESDWFLFKDNRLIAIPENQFELMKMLSNFGILKDASFYANQKD
jgi:hypothetical protein